MTSRNARLTELFARNSRRRNTSELRRKAKALGVLAVVGDEEDVKELQRLGADEPIEKLYPTTWSDIHPRLVSLLTAETEPVRLAPYDFQEFGFIRANPAALVGVLNPEPFQFDLDGFWMLGSFGAVCVDFDEAETGTDLWWTRYQIEPVRKHAPN